jgi:predicted DNA-binding transcriptional regulator YafY
MAQSTRRSPQRNTQLVRNLRILADLDRLGGVDLYELAERHGTTTRTIRRDLDALQEAGLPLEQVRQHRRQLWQLTAGYSSGRKIGLLDAGHYLALRLLEAQRGPAQATHSVQATLEDLSQKIEKAIGAKGREQLRDIEACFYTYDKLAYAQTAADVFWPLVTAVAENRLCQVQYRAPRHAGQDKSFVILPLKVFAYQGAAYLMCHIVKHDTLTSLNLQRLKGLTLLREHAQPPTRFDPDALAHAAFGVWAGGEQTAYHLRFDAEAAPYVAERIWHPSQRLVPLPEGKLELHMQCGASVEVEAWVASWREHVEVLAPAGLRRRLMDYALWLTHTYKA